MSEQTIELSNLIGDAIDKFVGESQGGGSLGSRVQSMDYGLQTNILWSGQPADTLVGMFANAPQDPLLDEAGNQLLDEAGQPLLAEGDTGITFGSETWYDEPVQIYGKHQRNVIGKRVETTQINVSDVLNLPDWVEFVIIRVTANILLSNWSVNGAAGSVANIFNRVYINGREAVENDLDHTMWEWVRLAGDRSIFTVNLGYTNQDVTYVPLNGGVITISHEAQNTSRATAVVEIVGYGSA